MADVQISTLAGLGMPRTDVTAQGMPKGFWSLRAVKAPRLRAMRCRPHQGLDCSLLLVAPDNIKVSAALKEFPS